MLDNMKRRADDLVHENKKLQGLREKAEQLPKVID